MAARPFGPRQESPDMRIRRRRLRLRALPILLGLCSCAVLAGCEDDFGEQARAFVNEEVHGISRAHVEAELDNIIAQAFGSTLKQLDAEAKFAAVLAQDFSTAAVSMDPQIVSNAELFAEFNSLDIQAGTIFRLITQLEADAALIRQLDTTCTDKSIYTALGIGNIGAEGPVGVATAALAEKKAEISVSASGGDQTPWWVTVGQLVVSLFGASEVDNQNGILRDSIALVPERIVHDAEVSDIYRVKCAKMLDELRPDFARLSALIDTTRQSITTTLTAVQGARAITEAILRTRDINQFLAASGVTQQLSDAQNLILRGQLGTDLQLTLRDLRARPNQIRQETQCVRALASIENYSDELKEVKVQLLTLRPDLAAMQDLQQQFDQSLQQVEQMLTSIDTQYGWARSAVCR
jgi:hypothetical protein